MKQSKRTRSDRKGKMGGKALALSGGRDTDGFGYLLMEMGG